jgi:SAM-dependent methyltransferase
VLDLGCGTGLLTNLFALRYSSQFIGVDFSTAADYADKFAVDNNIKNVKFINQDFFKFKTKEKFDVIIAQSFLTHVPDFEKAVIKIKKLLAPNGVIILGMFHPVGTLIKRFYKIKYNNKRLELDQLSHPFEQAFTKHQMIELFKEYELLEVNPSIGNQLVWLVNLFNARNSGLTMYVFRNTNGY